MKQQLPVFLFILLLSACAPAQAETFVSAAATPTIPMQVTPSAAGTPRPSAPAPDPGETSLARAWSTKSFLLTAYPAPAIPTETPTPTILPGSPDCRPTDLHASFAGDSGAAGHVILTTRVDNISGADCFLPAYPVVQLLDAARKPINILYSFSIPDSPIVPLQPTDEAHPGRPARYGLKGGQSALLSLWWSNGCDKNRLPKDFIIHIALLDKSGTIEVANHDRIGGAAACYDPASPSWIGIGPIEAAARP